MTTMLIGLHGPALSGKDTVARILNNRHDFHQMAFADPLKRATAVLFGWPVELCYSQEGKQMFSEVWQMQVRDALQKFGEGARQWFGADIWIKRWSVEYAPIMNSHHVVVSDVRYENEAETLRKLGGVIVHIRRPGAGLTGEQANHSSEKGIVVDENDMILDNGGTIDQLVLRVDGLVAFLRTNQGTAQ